MKKLNCLYVETLPTWEELMLYGKEVVNLLDVSLISFSFDVVSFIPFKDLILIQYTQHLKHSMRPLLFPRKRIQKSDVLSSNVEHDLLYCVILDDKFYSNTIF